MCISISQKSQEPLALCCLSEEGVLDYSFAGIQGQKDFWSLPGPHFPSQMNSFAVGMKGHRRIRTSAEQPPGRLHIIGISFIRAAGSVLYCMLA